MKRLLIHTLIILCCLSLITTACAQQPTRQGRPDRSADRPMRGEGGMGRGMSRSGAEKTYPADTPIGNLWQLSDDGTYYYIVGLHYCATPADSAYQQMGIYVPAAYLKRQADGTFAIDPTARVGQFTAQTAPIVLPVNTPGYAAAAAPSGPSTTVQTYTSEGLIYLWAGCRGRDHGAPHGVTDLKAAIRYYRYLASGQKAVPGNTDRIFSFGMSGGGAQSALVGASGDSPLFTPYLTAIGAKMDYPDHVYGSMCWCPITNLDLADAAYEWNMGLTRSNLTEADSQTSKALAAAFAQYINALHLKDAETGTDLSLTSTPDGYYQAGTYYELVMRTINQSIANYKQYHPDADITPYSTTAPDALRTFASDQKRATKGIGAFDGARSMSSPENTLMGIAGKAGHFDRILADIVKTTQPDQAEAFATALSASNTDHAGRTVHERLMMYTPMFYLVDNDTYYKGGGKGASVPATCWRIRTGIKQSDTALATELNLMLALTAHPNVRRVDFRTIWGQAHTEAEDTGNSKTNFVQWVKQCME